MARGALNADYLMSWPGLPILVGLAGQPVILLGAGEAAEAKRRLLERAGATVVDESGLPLPVRPELVEGRLPLPSRGCPSTGSERTDARPVLAVVAIEDEHEAVAAVARLKARGLLVNAVDRPDLCDFTLPAVVDRAPVLVAVATGGVSAGLAAAVRQRLEALLPASLGRLAEALGGARPALRARYPDPRERRRAIGAALAGPLDPLGGEAAERVEEVLLPPPFPAREGPGVGGENPDGSKDLPTPNRSLPGRGVDVRLTSSDPDDLTLRQARALALAERVFHVPDAPPAILARARADASRIASAARPAQMGPGDVWVELTG